MYNTFMENNPFENRRPAQEQIDIKVKITTPDEWEECKKLRIESITGPEARMMGLTPEKENAEINQSEEEWRQEANSETMFSVLAYNGGVAVGLGRTREVEKGIWRVRNGYVKPEFRNMGVQQKMLALRLKEIIERGGIKAITGIRPDNIVSIHNTEKFGFKKIGLIKRVLKMGRQALEWQVLELDLSKPEVARKIEEILNAK